MMIEIPGARAMLLFGFLLAVLLVRPQGIFTGRAVAA